MNKCETCKANRICDHNRFGWENCNNYISEDVEKITRCKNCTHYEPDIIMKGVGWCYKIDRGTGENSFCSEGWDIRKEKNND